MMSSREYAVNLRKLADWLDGRPEFRINTVTVGLGYQNYYDNKDEFLATVRAIGGGTKEKGLFPEYLAFKSSTAPEGTEVIVQINRDKVCKLVRPAQPAEYDCEPLLSQEEHAELESA